MKKEDDLAGWMEGLWLCVDISVNAVGLGLSAQVSFEFETILHQKVYIFSSKSRARYVFNRTVLEKPDGKEYSSLAMK